MKSTQISAWSRKCYRSVSYYFRCCKLKDQLQCYLKQWLFQKINIGFEELLPLVRKVRGPCGQCLQCHGMGEPWRLLHVQVRCGDLLRLPQVTPWIDVLSVLLLLCLQGTFSGVSSLWKLFLPSLSLLFCVGLSLGRNFLSVWCPVGSRTKEFD